MKKCSFKVGFIGAGKVGVTLSKYFSERNVCVSGLYDKNYRDAISASLFISSKAFNCAKDVVSDSDIIFITVNDGAIADVWQEIKDMPLKGKIVCHCSGALSSDVFDGIEQSGGFGCSVHPLFAVNSKQSSYKELSRAMFTIEGSTGCENTIKELFEEMGNQVQIISKDKKALYHTSAVFASNLVTAVAHISKELLVNCGFDEETAQKGLLELFQNNCENIAKYGFEKALTGPVERCDTATVKKHLSCIDGRRLEIYRLLSLELINIAKNKNPQKDYSELEQLLANEFDGRQEK